MSNAEKYQFLSTAELRVKPQSALRANSKIGDDDAVVTMYRAEVEGVVVSEWCETQKKATEQALENIEAWNEVSQK